MLLGVVIQQHRGEDQAGDIEGNVNAQEKAAQQDIQKGSEGVPKQVEDEVSGFQLLCFQHRSSRFLGCRRDRAGSPG